MMHMYVHMQYYPEVTHHCPGTPIILVGTKVELRDDKEIVQGLEKETLSPVTYVQGLQMQKEIGAAKYIECSTVTLKNVSVVFEEAVRAAMQPPHTHKEIKM